jgi:hypothetical protein
MLNRTNSFLALILLTTITVFFGATLPDTGFDYDFDKFFKPDDAATKYYQVHRDTFSTDNDFVLIGLVNLGSVFDPSFLEKVESLTHELAEVSHVIDVISPTDYTIPVRESLTGALFQKPLLTGNRERDSVRVFSDPAIVGNLFSTDTTALSIVILTSEFLSKEKSDELAKELNLVLSRYDFSGIHLSGRAIGQVVYIQKIQREFVLFMGIAITFVIVLLFVMFRSLRGIILPMATVLLAVVWSIGILNLSGRGISLLLNMLPPVIFVVGMSDAVHLYSRYIEELKKGKPKDEAIRLMVTDTGLATLLTSITTAIGFASLWFTGIPALREFGLLTAAGVLAAFIIAILMMPAWLILSKKPLKSLESPNIQRWDGFLIPLFSAVTRKSKRVFALTGALALVMIASLFTIDLNNFLLEDLKEGEKLRRDFTFFDRNFSGVRPFDMGIEWKTEDPSDPEYFLTLEKLHGFLDSAYGVGALSSPLNVIKELNRSRHGGRNDHYRLPETPAEWNRVLADYRRLLGTGKLENLTTTDGKYIRIMGRVGDSGAQHFAEKNRDFEAFLAKTGIPRSAEITVTGTGTLIDRTNQTLVGSLSKGLGAAFLLIAILMGLMFKSVRMVGIALVPNLLPLLAVGLVMAVWGIDLKMSTSIIFTIAFGIAVDDTIHILSRYKLELMKGRSNLVAIRNAYLYTGKALIITSIILFGGFIGLCFSSFQSTFYIGLFVTLTLIFALVFDFLLIPPLITLGNPRHKPSTTTFFPTRETMR